MTKAVSTPVLLELAPLPREQVGPFLLLGVKKTADKEQIEASWARCVILARKEQIKVPLEDINWAREMLQDRLKRVRADAASLNLDAADGVLARLTEEVVGSVVTCRPIDVEKDLSSYDPHHDEPDTAAIRAAIVVPDIPMEIPAAAGILHQFLQEPLDAWSLPVTW